MPFLFVAIQMIHFELFYQLVHGTQYNAKTIFV